ncbi:MAG: nucleotidyltransferase domain-containing protein [Promethearchaeota archaeon]|nr:MAG: nucleotidyltransferase domain-containing protein [Candidatus Lokiarchaeota archaeon]
MLIYFLIKSKSSWKRMKIKRDISDFISIIKEGVAITCVILFGSRARGDFTQFSDVDLIIIGEFTERFLDRPLKLLTKNNTPYNFEIFCYTELEFDSMFKCGNVLVLDAIYEGIPLEGQEFFDLYKERMEILKQQGLKRSNCTWILV